MCVGVMLYTVPFFFLTAMLAHAYPVSAEAAEAFEADEDIVATDAVAPYAVAASAAAASASGVQGYDPRWHTRQGRIEMVHEWQLYYNMEPRTDSQLTELFANGQVPMSPDCVARELMATDFIYKHTLYGEVIEEYLRRIAWEIKHRYQLSWTATWNIVRFYGPIALKITCLIMTGSRIPQFLP